MNPLEPKQDDVALRWGLRIPLRDGVHLSANLYLPREMAGPVPAICTLTPYIAQRYHDRALYFAASGYPFLAVDVRGRGNSEGEFEPHVNEARDAHDVVEWLAKQPYCDGQVAMWGGSYNGYTQWAAARELPPHLATMVPVASPYYGLDLPFRNNVVFCHRLPWLLMVSGRTAQDSISLGPMKFWNDRFRLFFESGRPFKEIDEFCFGVTSPIFQQWLAHPHADDYWDSRNPTPKQYAGISFPILTITGCYDAAQPGALEYYKRHMQNASPESRARHYLIIGPWDHAGTRDPKQEVGGIRMGPASVLDLNKLHCEWYAWTMQGGPKPGFLKKRVAYYVMAADRWCYADTLEEITARHDKLYVSSNGNPLDIFRSGFLAREVSDSALPDQYVYDPRDVRHAALESAMDATNLCDQRLLHALNGRRLVYHSEPFDRDIEVSGFFKAALWFSIDQPDTDIRVQIHEIDLAGASMLLTEDWIRARYRESLREEKLVTTREPQFYELDRFAFLSRLVRKGHRLRVVIGPIDSIHLEKNYNSGGSVAEESMKDARPVTVRLFHDSKHPSAVHMPVGGTDSV